MNSLENQPDDLQRIWRKDDSKPLRKENVMLLRLVQEKKTSLRDFFQGEDRVSYVIALSFAPLTAVAAWKSRALPWMQFGYLLMTLTLISGATVTWLYQRRATGLWRMDESLKDYQDQLLRFLNRQISFSKTVKYWYAVPLFAGFSFAIYPIVSRFLAQPWNLVAVASLFAMLEWSVWRMHDVQRVADLERKRREVEDLLRELNTEVC